MGAEFTFFDFVDDRGVNQIQDWLIGRGVNAYTKIDTEVRRMEALPREHWRWGKGIKGPMQGNCDSLYEIRRYDNTQRVQLRVLGFFNPNARGEFFMLLGTIEKGDKLPRSTCDTARARMAKVLSSQSNLKEHVYYEP